MSAFGNILIFHPAAIGDAVLATPVAKTLKLNFPAAKITYLSHSSLRQLLFGLCPEVDDFVDITDKTSFWDLVKIVRRLNPDLFVDLANSNKSNWLTVFYSGETLRYIKQPYNERPIVHAVDNFMETIKTICPELPQSYFPTLFPDALAAQIFSKLNIDLKDPNQKPLIGIVPGVGKFRPHRAWFYDGWLYLLKSMASKNTYLPILIGGEDEIILCGQLQKDFGGECLNLAGKLALTETAAVLKNCQVVISGDTGPAHLAVAVGTPVIGLYGPTYAARSGPYGYQNLVLDQSEACQCHQSKSCQLVNVKDPGECMGRIMLSEIIEKLGMIIPEFQKMDAEEVTPEFIRKSYMQ